jgi:hypothetical protein
MEQILQLWARSPAPSGGALTSFPGRTIAPLEATGVLYAGMWTEVSRQCAGPPSGRTAGRFGMGRRWRPVRTRPGGRGPAGGGAVAYPAAGDREMGNGHGEAELQCPSHPVVPVPSAVTLALLAPHARRAAPMRTADLSCG